MSLRKSGDNGCENGLEEEGGLRLPAGVLQGDNGEPFGSSK